MKTFKFIIITIAVSYLTIRIFIYYKATHLFNNEAVFNVYLDIKKDSIDNFFGLKKGTIDKEHYSIICQRPVNPKGYQPKSVFLRSDLKTIDCDHSFDKDIDAKYDNTELYGKSFMLYVIKGGALVAFFDADRPLDHSIIIAGKEMTVDYSTGKINNIIITADSAYNYCTKQRY